MRLMYALFLSVLSVACTQPLQPDTYASDPEAQAILDKAEGLEAISPLGALHLYRALAAGAPTGYCNRGPVSNRCDLEAWSRAQQLECKLHRGTSNGHADLGKLVSGIESSFQELAVTALVSLASCGFYIGTCDSDTGDQAAPVDAIPIVIGKVNLKDIHLDLQSSSATYASYTATGADIETRFLFQRPSDKAPWEWSGICSAAFMEL
jgi:hypothetical protein